jgi:hypothetical protein
MDADKRERAASSGTKENGATDQISAAMSYIGKEEGCKRRTRDPGACTVYIRARAKENVFSYLKVNKS